MAGLNAVWMTACVFCFLPISLAYNFVTSLPTVKKGVENTFFGYSVNFHVRSDVEGGPGILAGAPKDVFHDFPNLSHVPQPGRSYLCNLDGDYHCDTAIDKGHTIENLKLTVNNSLSGFAVCGSSKEGGSLITCAPHVRSSKNVYMSAGICLRYEKLVYSNYLGFCDQKEPYFDTYGLCNFGFSCAMFEEEMESIVVGAPGVVLWSGGLSRYFMEDDGFSDREAPLKNVMDPKGKQITDKYSYLGYSVAVGRMDGREVYVSGAPREKYMGYVFLLRYANSYLHLAKRLPGEKFGSYFGASVCLADINGDGETDLIVGAPLYHEPFVGGAIYVYIKKKGKGLEFEEPQKIKSRPMKEAECLKLNCFDARFGWSITSLKDIDYDGYQDIAVGAPFEGKGVVYIFRGSKDGLVPKYSQRIESKDVEVSGGPSPSPFGYSLDSRGIDVDGNEYPDLVVGSFRTDSVHLLRTSSVVSIDINFHSLPSVIDPEIEKCPSDGQPRNCFQVRVCLMTGAEQHHLQAKKALVNLTMEAEVYTGAHTSRVYFEGLSQKDGYKLTRVVELDLTTRREVCNNYKLYIGNNVKDFLNPIPMQLTYFIESNFPKYDSNKLLSLNDMTMLNGSMQMRELKVDFKKNCGDDNECRSELELRSRLLLQETSPDNYKLLVGLDKEVLVEVEVRNSEEDAHEASVFIKYPDSFKYLGSSEAKEKDQQVVSCSLSPIKDFIVCFIGNPFPSGGKVNFNLRFDPKSLTLSPEPLIIEVSTNTTSNDSNLENNKRTLKIEVTIESDLWVTGSSEPVSVFFGGKVVGESAMTSEEDIGLEVRHSYEVKNIGKARMPGSTLIISWPYELESHHPSGKHILYLLDPPLIEGSGECFFNPQIIDPLRLKHPAPSDDYNGDILFAKVVPKGALMMEKRDLVTRDKVLDCDLKTAKCHVFNCSIGELRPGQSVVVRLRARLWNSTFLMEFLKKEVAIRSKGRIVLLNDFVRQTSTDNDEFKVTTYALSDLRDEAQIPLWIIIVSVLAGILFLALLVFLLWKFGFFRRKRMSRVSTHKAVLMKEADS